MPPAGFEPTIPASERPKTQALDSATTGIGRTVISLSLSYTEANMFIFHCITSVLNCSPAFQDVQYDVLQSPLSSSNLFCDYESQVRVKVKQVTGTCLISLELSECLSNRQRCCIKQKQRQTERERDRGRRERERSSVVPARIINYDSSSSICCFQMYHRHTHSNNMV
jgi:hypothetical protein